MGTASSCDKYVPKCATVAHLNSGYMSSTKK